MSEIAKREKYEKDPRTPCRYGDKCYQKNPAHHAQYKHPPKKIKRKYNSKDELSKRIKLSESDEVSKKESQSSSNDEVENQEEKKECVSPSDSENSETGKERVCVSPSDSENSHIGGKNEPDNKKTELNETERQNEEEAPKSESSGPFDPKTFIKSRFLVTVPEDFYHFWELCKELKPKSPSDAFTEVNLHPVGPFDVLAGKFKHVKKPPEDYLCHHRYYYDPPEVLTVLKGDNATGYHISYFFDSPEAPPFMVSNRGTKDGVFTKLGDNIFSAVSHYLEELKKTGDPFKKMQVGRLLSAVKSRGEKLKLNMSAHSQLIKERENKVVAKTHNKIGLVVPYNKKTQLGYRDLAMEDKDLMTLLTKLQKAAPEQKSKYLSDLQPVLTYASIALDECDFGTGVKLGWELLYHGIDSLNSTIAQFLGNSYRLLDKEAFAKIAEAHMKNRKKGTDLSIV